MRALALCVLLLASPAFAQLPEPPSAPSDADVARARARFVRGMALAGEERWSEALTEFIDSYALSGSPVALFNIGSTLRSLHRNRAARAAFDRLLRDPDLDAETRSSAEAMRGEVLAQLGRVHIDGVPAGRARVSSDGTLQTTTDERPIRLELDAGRHALRVELAGHVRWQDQATVREGAEVRLYAELAPVASGDDSLPWILGGAVAGAVVLAAIIGAIVADAEAQLDARTPFTIVLP